VLTFALREDLDEISLDRGQVVILPEDTARAEKVVYQQSFEEIASELGITIRTVKEQRGRVMEKMEANSLAELVTMIVTIRLHESRMTTQRHTEMERD
jgi:hypothetical protein